MRRFGAQLTIELADRGAAAKVRLEMTGVLWLNGVHVASFDAEPGQQHVSVYALWLRITTALGPLASRFAPLPCHSPATAPVSLAHMPN
jgi:hypothetical protein